MKTGQLNVQTENILPIIKKFLYSDEEIFLRELVSNAVDASEKLKMLAKSGEYDKEIGDLKVKVVLDKEKNTITVKDNGIGMTEEEVEKYINEIAFSSAGEFLDKYKDKEEKGQQIIGHFGLGFYSAFMVANKVEIITQSYKDAKAVHWSCTGSTEFEIGETEKEDRGTDIVLHINPESKEFLEEERIRHLLEKYCKFMPIPVEYAEKQINETEPLWLKAPADLTAEDYKEFYNKLYPYSNPPLFWIHLNVDYPFNLTGILYFPKLTTAIEAQQNKIHLYSNQVFVTDKVNDIVPEFLTLLHGVIDSPDIPLNVSRSYLQSDSNVKKISSYIVRKVADKLNEIFKEDRKEFEEKWGDIGVFIKYGMLSHDKFNEKAKDFALLKNTEGEFFTVNEYKEKIKPVQTDKEENVVFLYTSDKHSQHTYIEVAKKKGYDVLDFDHPIDGHFVQLLERDFEKVTIKRVDADTIDKLIDKDEKQESVLSEEQQENLRKIYESVVNKDSYSIEMEALSPEDPPIIITQGEFERRMREMSQMSGMTNFPGSFTAKVNTNHPVAKKMLNARDVSKKEMYARHAFDLARLSQNMLKGEELGKFINRSVELIGK